MSEKLEALLRRDRLVVGTALACAAALAWAWTLSGAGMSTSAAQMTRDAGMSMPAPLPQWTPTYALLMVLMWWIMMVAMMLPSAAPTILLASALNRRSRGKHPPYGAASLFAAGYLACWLGFSVLATSAQWALQANGTLSAMMRSTSALLSGALLVAAGLWQLTPVKQACLRHCRSPVEFLTRRRRAGNAGALVMGLEHGAWCLGCCVFLMVLLFVGGVMDLWWIVGLAAWVLAEKLLPGGHRLSRIMGAALILAGLIVAARGA